MTSHRIAPGWRRKAVLVPLLFGLACAEAEDGLSDAAARDAATPSDAGELADAGAADADPTDAGPPDLGPHDSGIADAGIEDAADADGGALDADGPDAAAPDAADVGPADAGPTDTGASDATASDAGGCDYVNFSECVVDCNGTFTYAREFRDTNGRCPPFVRLNGTDYPDVRAAIAAESCSGACLYKAFQSVSFIDHCNRRNGYIVYTAANCPDLFEFSNGFFTSVADWEMATPCP